MKCLAVAASSLLICAQHASAQEFPLTIEHKFGSTTIQQAPERVATVDYNGADNLLALGVQPVMIRYWYGDEPNVVWPWADALMEGTPEVLTGQLNFEQLAAVEPDVITAVYSGITADEYAQLSRIAPVVAVPEGVGDYELGWEEQALTVGQAIGREVQAQNQVDAINDRLDGFAEDHPDLADKTVTLATYWDGAPDIYTTSDPRVKLLNQMGFENNAAVTDLSEPGQFHAVVSEEAVEPFNSDLLLWFADENYDSMRGLALREFVPAVEEGREIFFGSDMTSAMSHTSLLSLPYFLDRFEPLAEQAFGTGIPAENALTE